MSGRPTSDQVTFITPSFLPTLGGIEVHVANVGEVLQQAGWNVEVATQRTSPELAWRESDPNGFDIVRFKPDVRFMGEDVSAALARFAWARGAGGGLVHLQKYHSPAILLAGQAISRRPETGPIVITPHYLGIGPGAQQRAMHAVFGRAFKKVFARADVVIAVCDSEADWLVQDFGIARAKIRVIPNGVNVEQLEAAQPFETGGKSILVAGRLLEYKGHLQVVAALAQLPSDYELVVAGRGPLEPELRALADRLGVADRLRLVGSLSSPELARWYATADVLVSMSARECFGLTLVEALAAGAPFVASDIGPHQDVAKLCGYPSDFLLPLTSTPDQLARTIEAAVQRGRHAAGTYAVPSWSEVGRRHDELYRELLGT